MDRKRNVLVKLHLFQDETMPWTLLLLCLLSLPCDHWTRMPSPWVFCDRAGMFVIKYNNIIWKMYRCDNEYCCTYVFAISQKTMKSTMDLPIFGQAGYCFSRYLESVYICLSWYNRYSYWFKNIGFLKVIIFIVIIL